MATLLPTSTWGRPHGNTSCEAGHTATLLPTSMWGRPHGNTSCEAGHMATLLPTSMWGRPHGNTSCEAGHMATLLPIPPYQYVVPLMCLLPTQNVPLSLTQLNCRYNGLIMTESTSSYAHKTLQRFVALFSSHPLPLTVKKIQSTGSSCLKLLRTKLFCFNTVTFQWPHIRWKLLENGLTLLPSILQSHSVVLNSAYAAFRKQGKLMSSLQDKSLSVILNDDLIWKENKASVTDEYGAMVEQHWSGKTEVPGFETSPTPIYPTTNPTRTSIEVTSRLHMRGRQATKRVVHGTAFSYALQQHATLAQHRDGTVTMPNIQHFCKTNRL